VRFLLSRPRPGPYRVPPGRTGAMTDGGPVKKKRPAGWSPFAGIARIRSLGVAVQPLSCPRPLSLSSRLRSPRRSFGPAPSITSQTTFTLHDADDGRLESKARPARAKRRVSPKPAASRDGGAHASRSCPQGHSLAVAAGGPCRESINSRHDQLGPAPCPGSGPGLSLSRITRVSQVPLRVPFLQDVIFGDK
jgi:hypothetical protein